MRAAVCVRVSPRPQDKVKYSPEIQEAKCREWCDANGHEVVSVIQDILVSGGDPNRFDSIFRVLDSTAVDLCVVSDLSRWTRDDPERFWYIKHVLTERGVKLVSVDEPWLGADIPFAATITTAVVDSNNQQRIVSNRKTSAGIRAAMASGKVWWKHYGWTWNPERRAYDKDTDKIRSLYEQWVRGDSAMSIARRLHVHASHVKRMVAAEGQRSVVGDDLWLAAQARIPGRAPRNDARHGNVYRGMMRCPFCGRPIHRPTAAQPFSYGCTEAPISGVSHDWRFLDVRRYVTPNVSVALSRLAVPDEMILRGQESPPEERNYDAEIERLTMAWVKGRVPNDRYEKAVSALEVERDRPRIAAVPVPQQIELSRFAEHVDLETQDVELANALNRVLRLALDITVNADRTSDVVIRHPYAAWARD